MLEGLEAIHVGTVLSDCADQLAVLGKIMPASFDGRPDVNEIVRNEISQLVDGQLQLESKFDNLMIRRQDMKGIRKSAGRVADLEREVQSMGGDLKNSTHVFGRSLKQSPLTSDNLSKTQEDRVFLEHIVVSTLAEMKENGGFSTLLHAVQSEKEKKSRLQETILKEEEGRKKVKTLQRRLVEVKKEKETELQQRNEMIAHLKDQLQEMKAKTHMEGKYNKKCAEVTVAMTQKRCLLSEKEMRDEIESLRQKIDEENRVNAEIESYLRTHQVELELRLDYWMERYDKDFETKRRDLELLTQAKSKDLDRLQELTKLYAEYEQVVVEDRIDKEKIRRKDEQESMELKAATKLQSWWRMIMVIKGIGAFSKKKKKGKKGKKSGKGKKKKK